MGNIPSYGAPTMGMVLKSVAPAKPGWEADLRTEIEEFSLSSDWT